MSTEPNFKHLGTVISGTHRPEEIIPAYREVLRELDPQAEHKIANEFAGTINVPGVYLEDDAEVTEALHDALDECAPEGYYFGTHIGDGADFGFWSWDDAEGATSDISDSPVQA